VAIVAAGALTAGLFAAGPLGANAAPRARSNWTFVSSGILTAPSTKATTPVVGHRFNPDANGIDYTGDDGSDVPNRLGANGI